MKKVTVNSAVPYEIIIGRGCLDKTGQMIDFLPAEKVMIVSDSTVSPLYLERVKRSVEANGRKCFETVITQGEENKNAKTYIEIITRLAEEKLTRRDMVLALGGGVVTDIAGFAAATYMRGIDVVMCPTTLLGAIDASVGGKTGIDLKQGKNLLGAFHSPRLVVVDTDVFATLEEKDWKNGLGEGIKYALLCGGEIAEIVRRGVKSDIERFVELCVAYKRDIVERDFFEKGDRKLLNLGHTFAHGAEMLSDYTLPHGIAVAKGIIAVCEYSYRLGKLSLKEKNEVLELAKSVQIETSMPFSYSELVGAMDMDKKMENALEVSLVVPYGIGNCKVEKTPLKKILEVLK